MTKRIVFDECRSIPGVGLFKPGDETVLDDKLADQFIAQKIARELKPALAPSRAPAKPTILKEDEHGE